MGEENTWSNKQFWWKNKKI